MSDVVERAKSAQSLTQGWSVHGDWVAADAGGCTCHGAGPGHVPGCGEEPIGRISDDPLLAFAAAARTLVPELVAEVERLRAEFDQAVADWGENDEQMLAENARLAAEIEELQPLPRGVEEYLQLVEADDPAEAFNLFIRQWVAPKWHGHLLDSDDNDGEAVRRIIRRYAR